MKLKFYISLLSILLLNSCGIGSYYAYVHKPTEAIKNCIWTNDVYKEAKCLKGKDLVLIPDFRAFTSSFSLPDSRLYVYSKFRNPIWISTAILKVKGENVKTVITFNKEFPFREALGETGYQTVIVLLFNEKNTDYSKYSMKKELELEISYKPTKEGPEKSESFKLTLKKKWDIIWPT